MEYTFSNDMGLRIYIFSNEKVIGFYIFQSEFKIMKKPSEISDGLFMPKSGQILRGFCKSF